MKNTLSFALTNQSRLMISNILRFSVIIQYKQVRSFQFNNHVFFHGILIYFIDSDSKFISVDRYFEDQS